MMRSIVAALFALWLSFACSGCSNSEKPEVQARTLQPFPFHTLPLGVTLDSLQKILHGHSALFTPIVKDRMYRIVPLNAYGNVGFGAVELFPDGKSRSYYWYTNLATLNDKERRYYTAEHPPVNVDLVLDSLKRALGEPKVFSPYPKEDWFTWRTDSAQLNLTLQNKHITLTKTAPSPVAMETDPGMVEEVAASTPKTASKAAVKKKTPAKKPVAKKPVKKATTKK